MRDVPYVSPSISMHKIHAALAIKGGELALLPIFIHNVNCLLAV